MTYNHYGATELGQPHTRRMNLGRFLILLDFTFLASAAEGAVFLFLLDDWFGDGSLGLAVGTRGVAGTLKS